MSKTTRKRGRPSVIRAGVKPHAVYPTPEEKELLQQFADQTRRTLGGAILYLALNNPEFQSTHRFLEGGRAQ